MYQQIQLPDAFANCCNPWPFITNLPYGITFWTSSKVNLLTLLSCLHMGNSIQTRQRCWSSLIILCLLGNRFKREHGQILIACAWTYAAVFACSPLAHWGEYGAEPYGTACCIDWHSTNVNAMATSYTLVLFVFCFVLPCGIIVTSYSLIL